MKLLNVIAGFLLATQATGCTPTDAPRIYVIDATLLPGESGSGLWRPTRSQALAATEALRAYIGSPSFEVQSWDRVQREEVRTNFNSYVLQIEGVRKPYSNRVYGVDGNGPKQIHFDGFCPSIVKDFGRMIEWKQMLVADGDSCVFYALFDVDSGHITYFELGGN